MQKLKSKSTKSEYLNSKQILISQFSKFQTCKFGILRFSPSTALRTNGEQSRTIRIWDLFRISDLGFRIFKFALPLFILVFGFWISSYAQEWQELKGEHFLVYFTQDKKFAQEVLDKAEVYYQRIASDLGYPRYSEFWLWDKRVKIYIYPDHASFLAATGQPQWSQGMADYKNKQIISFLWSKGFLESLLPHEMAHLIFRDFVGFKGEIPLWLDEGVAQWAEEAKRGEMKFKVQQLFEKDALLSLEDMIRLDIRNVTEKDRVYIRSTRTKEGDKGIVFLSGDNLITTYYLQSVSLVGFLIEKYGSERFADFCRQLRDGKTIEEALKFAYPVYMRNLKELENRWREYLSEN